MRVRKCIVCGGSCERQKCIESTEPTILYVRSFGKLHRCARTLSFSCRTNTPNRHQWGETAFDLMSGCRTLRLQPSSCSNGVKPTCEARADSGTILNLGTESANFYQAATVGKFGYIRYLPKVPDTRQTGTKYLRQVLNHGVFHKGQALTTLTLDITQETWMRQLQPLAHSP